MTNARNAEINFPHCFAWLAIPFLFIAIIVLWATDIKCSFESPSLVMSLNFITRTVACLLIMFMVGRGFLIQGSPGMLLLGCGVAIWGATGFVASSSAFIESEANLGVTITNIGLFLAAFCHLLGVSISTRLKLSVRATGLWLCLGYALALIGVGLITLATLEGLFPIFFVDGQGGTTVRYVVLGASIAMFVFTSVLLWKNSRHPISSFTYWYALALLLIAIGVFGMMLQSSRGSWLNWACRTTQYLAGVYMFIAAAVSVRDMGAWEIRLNEAEWDRRAAVWNDQLLRFLTPQSLWALPAVLRYSLAVVIVVVATVLRWELIPLMGIAAPYNIALLAVIGTTILLGIGPGLLSLLLCDLAVELFILGSLPNMLEKTTLIRMSTSMIIGVFICYVLHAIRASQIKTRRSEDLSRMTLQALPAHIAVLDRKGRIIAVNQAWTEFASNNEAVGLDTVAAGANYLDSCRRAAGGDGDAAQALAGIEAVLNGTKEQFTMEYPCHSPQEKRWFLMTVVRLGASGEEGAVITHLNITERKKWEESLRSSLEQIEFAEHAAKIGFWDWDIVSEKLIWSKEIYALFGLDPSEKATFDTFLKALHPDDRNETMAKIKFSIDKRTKLENEYRIILPDGQIRWINAWGNTYYDSTNKPLRMCGVCCDITERKMAEEALKLSEERLNVALEAGEFGIWGLDVNTKNAWRSLRHDQIFGYKELLPKWTYEMFLDHVLTEDRERVDIEFGKAISSGIKWNFECRIKRADGVIRWIWAQGKPIFGNQNEVVKISGFVKDITDRKRTEAEIRQHAEDLQAKNKELERFNRAMVDRELRMIELKKQIAELQTRLGEQVESGKK